MIAIIKRNTAAEIVSIYRLTNGHQIILIRAALELESGEGLIWQLDCMAHTRGIARPHKSHALQRVRNKKPEQLNGNQHLLIPK